MATNHAADGPATELPDGIWRARCICGWSGDAKTKQIAAATRNGHLSSRNHAWRRWRGDPALRTGGM